MEKDKSRSRRQFLRNIGLSGVSLGLLPLLPKSTGAAKIQQPPCNLTTADFYGQGPFYTPNAPEIVGNQLAGESEPGTRLILSGLCQSTDCQSVNPNVLIDIWHANQAGAYDNSGFNLRGKTYTNAQGFYLFETILPGKYLNGGSFRPRHIHFKITPQNGSTLTTQLYFEGDSSIPGDLAASWTMGTYDATNRIIPLTDTGMHLEGIWDIGINGNGSVGLIDDHGDKGLIYSASPNPFSDALEIKYGIFKKAKVNIEIFNLQGNRVATLDERVLSPEKYTAVWQADSNLPTGVYFVALKLNDLQIHYIKVIKK